MYPRIKKTYGRKTATIEFPDQEPLKVTLSDLTPEQIQEFALKGLVGTLLDSGVHLYQDPAKRLRVTKAEWTRIRKEDPR